jgi:hypothetical protein
LDQKHFQSPILTEIDPEGKKKYGEDNRFALSISQELRGAQRGVWRLSKFAIPTT